MTGRRRQPKDGSFQDTLTLTIADAVEAAAEAADDAGVATYQTVPGKSGLRVVFMAAREAVAETEPGNIGSSVFDTALRAAVGAVTDSSIPSNYDRMRRAVMSIPDRLVRMAARQAANDLFAKMPAKAGKAGDGRLLRRMRAAAVRAAKVRLGRDDGIAAVRAATDGARDIADRTVQMTSEIVLIGAPVHAATAAVFGVAIQGVQPASLAEAIREACEDLPEVARRHDDLVVGFVAALSAMIAADAEYRRKYQTAVRGAEKLSLNEAADQIVNMITGNTFEAVYMALVAGAYATSDGSAFESGYGGALAGACGVNPRQSRQAWMGGIPDGIPPDVEDGIPEEVFQEMHQRLSGTMEWLFASEAELARQRRFRDALNVDYKAAASGRRMGGIVYLYEVAYRAGYEGARATAAKEPGDLRRRR